MEKHELVGLTLQKLLDHFASSPESFDYFDDQTKNNTFLSPTIFWQPKIQLGDPLSGIVTDPNNSHAVIVVWNNNINVMTCYIMLKAPTNLIMSSSANADCVITSERYFERWRGNYRKFKKLRKLILARDRKKDALNCYKKLSSIFPDTLDSTWLDK